MFSAITNTKNILGINQRNLRYLRPYNPKRARKIADDKLHMKRISRKAKIATPEVYAVIRNRNELSTFDWEKLPNSYVVKPRKGYGGAGILVVFGRNRRTHNWVKADKSQVSPEMLETHVANIIDGTFSLKNAPDYAVIEQRVKLHPILKPVAYRGIPDVRIIVFNNVPVMAMLRLPTKQSGGTANLHTGGVGVGMDMGTGVTTNAIQHFQIIERHPDTGMPLSGIKLPFWKTMLQMAVRGQLDSGLGFMGIDIALDRDQGPVVFEMNARPGLGIQICNLEGLEGRLRRVKGIKVKTVAKGVRLAKDLFGGEIEEEVEEITGREVIGPKEYVTFYTTEGKKAKICKAKIDTGAYLTSIDKKLAFSMGFKEAYEHFESLDFKKKYRSYENAKKAREKYYGKVRRHKDLAGLALSKSAVGRGIELRPVVFADLKLSGVRIKAKTTISFREHLRYRALIGRRALKPFLIDPIKKPKKPF